MADSNKLWFEMDVRSNVANSLNKILSEVNSLQGAMDKVVASVEAMGKIDKVKFDNTKAIQNALKYKSMLEQIDSTIARINERKMYANVDTNKLNIAKKNLEEFRKQLERLQTYPSDMWNGDMLKVQQAAMRNMLQQVKTLMNESTEATSQNTKANNDLVSAYDKVIERGGAANRVLSQMKNQWSGFISLYGAERLLKNIIQIGGEFEVQHIALQSILGDLQQANTAFNQMKQLAVVSPFNFRQLVTYQKQTAAFGIPYEELYDTTKRLADMSAGLGVDMGRLILAFGQVRSAAVLRGQELRQFTEAGIPMVRALAEEFTKLKGEVVETGDVFELISKRQVPFEMVKKIMWDMTSEGGRFYNMQFKLADTLTGKWSNLQDAWEIMLSEFARGESLSGKVFKGLVELTTKLIENINSISSLLTGLGVGYGAAKISKYFAISTTKSMSMSAIDANIKKAQMLNIIKQRERYLQGEITAAQMKQNIEVAKNTSLARQQLFMSGRISIMHLKNLDYKKRENRELVVQLVQLGMIDRKMGNMLLKGQKMKFTFTTMGQSIKTMFSGINLGLLGIEAAFAVIGTLIGSYISRQNELKEAVKAAFDSMKQQYEDLHQFIKNNPIDVVITGNNEKEIKALIEKYKQQIRESSPISASNLITASTYGDGGKEKSPSEQLSALRKQAELIEQSKQYAKDLAGAFDYAAESAGGVFRTEVVTEMQDYQNAIADFQKMVGKRMSLTDFENLSNQLIGIEKNTKAAGNRMSEYEKKAVAVGKRIRELLAAGASPETIGMSIGGMMSEKDIKSATKTTFASSSREIFGWKILSSLSENMDSEREDFEGKLEKMYTDILRRMKAKNISLSSEVGRMTFENLATEFYGKNQFSEEMVNFSNMFFENLINQDFGTVSNTIPNVIANMMEGLDKEGIIKKFISGEDVSDETKKKVGEIYENAKETFIAKYPQFKQLLQQSIGAQGGLIIPLNVQTSLSDGERQLSTWQKEVQAILDKHHVNIKVDASMDRDAIVEAIKNEKKRIQSDIERDGSILINLGINKNSLPNGKNKGKMPSSLTTPWQQGSWTNYAQSAEDEVNLAAAEKELGTTDITNPKKNNGGGGNKTDKQLEKWRRQLKELREFWREYETLLKRMSSNEAIKEIRERGLFPSMFGKNGNLKVDVRKGLSSAIDDLLNQIKATTEARKEFKIEVKRVKFDVDDKTAAEAADALFKKLEKSLSEQSKKWDLYKKIFDKTANRNIASDVAFGAGAGDFKNFAEQLRSEISNALNELPKAKGISINELLSKDDKQLGDLDIREKGADGVYLRLQKLREVEIQLASERINGWLDAVKYAHDYQLELDLVHNKYEKLRSDAEAQRSVLGNTKTDQIVEGLNKAENREASKIKFEEFKEKNDWGRVFGNLSKVSLPTIKRLLKGLADLSKNTGLSVEETKAVREAMEKLTKEGILRSPLMGITDTMNNLKGSSSAVKQAKKNLKIAKMSPEERAEQGFNEETVISVADAEKQYADALDNHIENLSELVDRFDVFAQHVQNLGNELSSLGSKVGGSFGDTLSGFGSMFNSIGSGMQSLKAAKQAGADGDGFGKAMGSISAIISLANAMVDLNMALDKILPSTEKLHEEYVKQLRAISLLQEAIADYRIAAEETYKAKNDWIYSNGLSDLKSNSEKMKATQKAYFETLAEPQAIYKDKRSGIKKYGVPIAVGIMAAVAGAFTMGTGAAAVLGVSTAIGAAAVATIGAGVGFALANAAQSGIEAVNYRPGETAAMNNLRIQTRHASFWRGQKTKDVRDWVRENIKDKYGNAAELFDKDGMLDLDAAGQLLEKYGNKLVGETKETLERLVELQKEYNEFIDSIHKYVSESFSPLIDNMTEAIWDWVANGTDALETFRKNAGETFEKIAKDAIKSFLKITVLDHFQKQLDDLFKKYSLKEINEEQLMQQVANIASGIESEYQRELPVVERLSDMLYKTFYDKGYDIAKGSTTNSNLVTGVQELTESTGSLLASYINEIRAYAALNTGFLSKITDEQFDKSNTLAESQLRQLELIAVNTATTANNTEKIGEIFTILHDNVIGSKPFYIS